MYKNTLFFVVLFSGTYINRLNMFALILNMPKFSLDLPILLKLRRRKRRSLRLFYLGFFLKFIMKKKKNFYSIRKNKVQHYIARKRFILGAKLLAKKRLKKMLHQKKQMFYVNILMPKMRKIKLRNKFRFKSSRKRINKVYSLLHKGSLDKHKSLIKSKTPFNFKKSKYAISFPKKIVKHPLFNSSHKTRLNTYSNAKQYTTKKKWVYSNNNLLTKKSLINKKYF